MVALMGFFIRQKPDEKKKIPKRVSIVQNEVVGGLFSELKT